MSKALVPSSSSATPAILLPEALGFHPQLLLDDIINIANAAVTDAVNGMEAFLQRWADERTSKTNTTSDITNEIESGLVAFQTLLEYHTDIAFDFFEAWCLRNIFAVPEGLSFVLSHQEGLDLSVKREKEAELMAEVEGLRRQLADVCSIVASNDSTDFGSSNAACRVCILVLFSAHK